MMRSVLGCFNQSESESIVNHTSLHCQSTNIKRSPKLHLIRITFNLSMLEILSRDI